LNSLKYIISDFINLVSENGNEISIDIPSEISIKNNIIINNSIDKIIILGNSPNSSSIKFENENHYIKFSINVKEIEIKNITIIGNIIFDNNEKITMDNVSITGMIDSNFKIKNDFFIIKNIHYTPNSNPEDICVNLGGNLEIENSKFFGGISCIYRLMKFYGFNKYNISINNSYFSGEYACAILFIDTTNKADIKNSVFEKVFSNNSEG